MYAEQFPAKLKEARKYFGFSQAEVARELNIPPGTLANYELGRTQPDIEMLGKLAVFYEVSLDWLLGTGGGKHIS